MVKSLFVWSRDLWNGERGENGNLSNAESVIANKASEQQQKEWPFCSLYYEEGTADDNEGTPIAFATKTSPWDNGTLTVKTVRCIYPDGITKDFVFPDPKSIAQDYDLRQSGEKGLVNYTPLKDIKGVRQGGVSFYVDEIMDMGDGSAESHREKVKTFLAKQIDAKISGAMSASSKNAETFESEFSVERVNPTVVEGQSDVYGAETFASDGCGCGMNNCMCADNFEADIESQDVMINDSSMDTVYPEGDGRIMGQSISSADLTPLGTRAEEYHANGAIQDVSIQESPADFVIPQGEGSVIGQSTPTTDFTPLGARADGFENKGFAMEGFYPQGNGRVFGDITGDNYYTPMARAEEEPEEMARRQRREENRGSSRFGMGSGSANASPFIRASENAEDFNAYDDPMTDRQKYKIGKLGGRMSRGMSRSKASDYIKELQGQDSGTWRAEGIEAQDTMIDESSMDTVWPEGDGRIMGQSIASADLTPLGSRADTMKGGSFFAGVASAFAVGLIANMLMMKKSPVEDSPDDSSEPSDEGE